MHKGAEPLEKKKKKKIRKLEEINPPISLSHLTQGKVAALEFSVCWQK